MSCPEGLVPSVDYVTCEPLGESTHRGIWRYPADANVPPAGIFCGKPLCKDLSENYYDETVDVSFS